MPKLEDRTLGDEFIPIFFSGWIIENKYDIENLYGFLTQEDRAKVGETPDLKELLNLCYKSEPLETLDFLLQKSLRYLEEAAQWYKAMLYVYGMTDEDPKKVQECYRKFVWLEDKLGERVKEALAEHQSDVITRLPAPPSEREQLKSRLEELNKKD